MLNLELSRDLEDQQDEHEIGYCLYLITLISHIAI